MTDQIAIGTAVTTNQRWPYNEGIVKRIDGSLVQIEKYGAKTRDYVGGGTFTTALENCTPDTEINAALEQIKSHRAVVAQLKADREARGLRLESKMEHDLRREADRIQRNINAL